MDYEEFKNKIKTDDNFLRLVIRAHFRYYDFAMIEGMFNIPENSFDKLFVEDPAFENIFAEKVRIEFSRIQRLYGWPRLNAALSTLGSLASTMDDDQGSAVRAATALVKAQQALIDLTDPGEEEEDDIDKLWRMVENEQKTRKNAKADNKDIEDI